MNHRTSVCHYSNIEGTVSVSSSQPLAYIIVVQTLHESWYQVTVTHCTLHKLNIPSLMSTYLFVLDVPQYCSQGQDLHR